MGTVQAVVIEVREDQHEESIRASLFRKGPKDPKTKPQPKAAVAGTDDAKDSKAELSQRFARSNCQG